MAHPGAEQGPLGVVRCVCIPGGVLGQKGDAREKPRRSDQVWTLVITTMHPYRLSG